MDRVHPEGWRSQTEGWPAGIGEVSTERSSPGQVLACARRICQHRDRFEGRIEDVSLGKSRFDGIEPYQSIRFSPSPAFAQQSPQSEGRLRKRWPA